MARDEQRYIIDTSALVNLYQRTDNGAGWKHFVYLVEDQYVKTIESVSDEIERRFPDLYKLFKPYKGIVLINQYEPDIWAHVGKISESHQRLYQQLSDRNNSADPWLIAAAKVHGYKIVTDERESGSEYTHRIPYVASRYGVPSCGLRIFLEDTGYGQ